MSPRYMLDTDTFIFIRQKRPTQVRQRFERLTMGEAAISVITYGELRYGAEKSARRESLLFLTEMTRNVPVLPMPAAAAEAYGTVRTALERGGEMIGNNDLWIAAHAKTEGLTLVTNNDREFKRVAGLQIENWASR